MKRVRSKYVCQSCGYEAPRWMGKCPECGSWNAFAEEAVGTRGTASKSRLPVTNRPVPILSVEETAKRRIRTGMGEFDRVLGGGIVPGSALLLGGAPGIGKSTLLLQVCARLAGTGRRVLYVTGEESPQQVRMRAGRLEAETEGLFLLAETEAESILAVMEEEAPGMVVVDSIQTVQSSALEGLPGNVSQVRQCGHLLSTAAKKRDIPLFLVGHVNKEGSIAGPRVLEHLVDALVVLEGEGQNLYRILRAVKNRFGSTNEVGLFEMTDRGMREVAHPSEVLLSHRQEGVSGAAVTVSMEGTRPLLVEVQALVTPTSYGIPQRTTTGFDPRRLALLLAVLEKRVGLRFGNQDVFVNTAGGLRLREPAVDLSVALAIASSLKDRSLGPKTAVIGEIGLGGELRGISHAEKRVAEVERLGFEHVLLPGMSAAGLKAGKNVELTGIDRLDEAVRKAFS